METLNTPCGPHLLGYLAENWIGLNEPDTVPAVIVNPDATPLALLAWCWGEAKHLSDISALLCASGEVDPGIFYHRLPGLTAALEHAIERLRKADSDLAQVVAKRTGRKA